MTLRCGLVWVLASVATTVFPAAERGLAGEPVVLDFTSLVLPTGRGPGSVIVADVNGDRHPDLVVANVDDQTVSVLLGDGSGQFSAAAGSPFPCGPGANDIDVADLNRDGHADLVVANTETPRLTVLLGDGHGRFTAAPGSPFTTSSTPHVHGVAVGDFMGAGRPPAVVTDSWGRNEILLIPSDARGSLLGTSRAFATGTRPYERLRTADFNGDGKPDVVTTNLDDDTVTILLGDGRGGLSPAPGSPFRAGRAPWAVAVDDLNHDGALDLAVIPYAPDVHDASRVGLTVLLGDGHGAFATMAGSPWLLAGCEGPDRTAAGDLTGSGRRDVVVTCAQNDRILLFLADGAGGFRTALHDVGTGWSGLAVADVNGDGRDEIVVSNNKTGTVTVVGVK